MSKQTLDDVLKSPRDNKIVSVMTAVGAVAMPASLAAQIVFTPSASKTISGFDSIGVAVQSGSVYVSSTDNTVQLNPSNSLTQVGSAVNAVTSVSYMNDGPSIGQLTLFDSGSHGFIDMNSSTGNSGSPYGPSSITSFSSLENIGGTNYRVIVSGGNVELYNQSTPNAIPTQIIPVSGLTGLSNVAAIEFGRVGSNLANTTFLAGESDGKIVEFNAVSGSSTGQNYVTSVLSGGSLTGMSFDQATNKFAYTSDNGLASNVVFGDLQIGSSIPEPSTYALLFAGAALVFADRKTKLISNALNTAYSKLRANPIADTSLTLVEYASKFL